MPSQQSQPSSSRAEVTTPTSHRQKQRPSKPPAPVSDAESANNPLHTQMVRCNACSKQLMRRYMAHHWQTHHARVKGSAPEYTLLEAAAPSAAEPTPPSTMPAVGSNGFVRFILDKQMTLQRADALTGEVQCILCDEGLPPDSVAAHMAVHDPNGRPFECKMGCKYYYMKTQHDLDMHAQRRHNKSFVATAPPPPPQRRSRRSKTAEKSKPTENRCPLCDRAFDSLEEVDDHCRGEHGRRGRYACRWGCGQRAVFEGERELYDHWKKSSHSSSLPSTADKSTVEQPPPPSAEEEERLPFLCMLGCKEVYFESMPLLLAHITQRHGDYYDATNKSGALGNAWPIVKAGLDSWECSVCGHKNMTAVNWGKHVKVHDPFDRSKPDAPTSKRYKCHLRCPHAYYTNEVGMGIHLKNKHRIHSDKEEVDTALVRASVAYRQAEVDEFPDDWSSTSSPSSPMDATTTKKKKLTCIVPEIEPEPDFVLPPAEAEQLIKKAKSMPANRNGVFVCEECPFVDPSADLVIEHRLVHTRKGRPFSCSLGCPNMHFKSASQLSAHVASLHAEVEEQCAEVVTPSTESVPLIVPPSQPPCHVPNCHLSSQGHFRCHSSVERPFECLHGCVQIFFPSPNALKHHIRNGHGESAFKKEEESSGVSLKCDVCSFTANRREYLINHEGVHVVKKFKCKSCVRVFFESEEQLGEHCSRIHPPSEAITTPSHCVLAACKSTEALHDSVHDAVDKTYKCTFGCEKWFYASDKQLFNHVLEVHGKLNAETESSLQRAHRCAVCSFATTRFAYLVNHGKLHTKSKHKCPSCVALYFTSPETLAVHKLYVHPLGSESAVGEVVGRSSVKSEVVDSEKVLCSQCNITFAGSLGLTMHVKTLHEGKGTFRCAVASCMNTRHDNSKQLRHHYKANHASLPPQCKMSECQARYLPHHKVYHTPTVYKCLLGCNRWFLSRPTALLRHYKKTHGVHEDDEMMKEDRLETPLPQTQVPTTIDDEPPIAPPDRPFGCEVCGVCAVSADLLSEHVHKEHGEKNDSWHRCDGDDCQTLFFGTAAALQWHKEEEHCNSTAGDSVRCGVCPLTIKADSVVGHEQTRHTPRAQGAYRCILGCEQTFSNDIPALLSHINAYHGVATGHNRLSSPSTAGGHTCSICGFSCETTSALGKHAQRHVQQDYRCLLGCVKWFYEKGEGLQKHYLNVHNAGDKCYVVVLASNSRVPANAWPQRNIDAPINNRTIASPSRKRASPTPIEEVRALKEPRPSSAVIPIAPPADDDRHVPVVRQLRPPPPQLTPTVDELALLSLKSSPRAESPMDEFSNMIPITVAVEEVTDESSRRETPMEEENEPFDDDDEEEMENSGESSASVDVQLQAASSLLLSGDCQRAETIYNSRMHVSVATEDTLDVQCMRRMISLANATHIVNSLRLTPYKLPQTAHQNAHALDAHLYSILCTKAAQELNSLYLKTLMYTARYAQKIGEKFVAQAVCQMALRENALKKKHHHFMTIVNAASGASLSAAAKYRCIDAVNIILGDGLAVENFCATTHRYLDADDKKYFCVKCGALYDANPVDIKPDQSCSICLDGELRAT